VLGSVGIALHHKLCHTIGGSFNLPHAETHTIVLPHSIAFNAPATPDAMHRIARALGSTSAATGLFELVRALKLPHSLREIGFQPEDIDKAAGLAMRNPYWNPRPFSQQDIRELLERAYVGDCPQ
jgi:maleylacetate reductase